MIADSMLNYGASDDYEVSILRFKFHHVIKLLLGCATALFLTTALVSAANIYVRSGATGNASGSDWINACPSIPSTLVRGNTYYIADGIYKGATFKTPAKGATLITIKKATIADHGTATGWSNVYGDGEARFTDTIVFGSSYWLFDGQTGGGPDGWTSGFGFHVIRGVGSPVIYKAPDVSFITIQHINVEGDYGDGPGSGNANDGICLDRGNNILISHCYIHDAGRCLIFGRADFVIIEYCYGGAFESTSSEHSELASIWGSNGLRPHDWTVRNSIWTHFEGTGGFMMDGAGLIIDGCVFSQLNRAGGGNGVIGTWTDSQLTGLNISNSSFINLYYPAIGILNADDNGTFRNNAVFNSYLGSSSSFTRLVHDFNAYTAVLDGAPIDVHPLASNTQPFDFGLSQSGCANISTRALVGTKDDVLISGFIITNSGDGSKCRLVVRAIGPSLKQSNISSPLLNPTLDVYDGAGHLIASNDNWQQGPNATLISSLRLAPLDSLESALLVELPAGLYTAVIRGKNGTSGIALAEVYSLGNAGNAKLANVSSRGQVKSGDQAMIGGFILQGNFAHKIIVRAMGPSLASAGVANILANPTLELMNGQGTRIAFNDNWSETQRFPVEATGIPPGSPNECAIVRTLPPGRYTAIVRSKDGTAGTALVEVYLVD